MADLQLLVSKLDKRVQPKEEDFKFAPADLEEILEDALMEHNPSYTIESLPKEEEHLVIWLAIVTANYQLANKHAENMRFRIENDEYHGDQPHRAYVKMAEMYQKKYNENKSIEVTTVTRTQTGTGNKAGFYPGDKP